MLIRMLSEDRDMDLDAFIDLESRVWDALRRGDVEEDMRLLAEDFLGVYSIGFAGRSDHAGQLANGPTVAEFELHDARPTRVDVRQLALVPTLGTMGE